ncbi:PH domain-containing protein [Terrisporobacter sp.]
MKLCYFNYFLNEGERIIFTFECRLKAINTFQILDKEGILIATNSRLLFCKVIGEHPHLLQSYEYKYLTSMEFKEDGNYLYAKYNGDPLKISSLDKDEIDKILLLINNEKVNSIFTQV